MGAMQDAIKAMKEVILLADKVERAGELLDELSSEVRGIDKRLIKLEAYFEIAKLQAAIPDKSK